MLSSVWETVNKVPSHVLMAGNVSALPKVSCKCQVLLLTRFVSYNLQSSCEKSIRFLHRSHILNAYFYANHIHNRQPQGNSFGLVYRELLKGIVGSAGHWDSTCWFIHTQLSFHGYATPTTTRHTDHKRELSGRWTSV